MRETKNRLARSAKEKAAQAEKEYQDAPDYAILPKDTKAKFVSGKGVSKQEFAHAYNSRATKDGKKKGLANAMEMYSAGASYNAAAMVSSDVSEEVWSKAKGLADNGISPSTLQTIANSMDSNNNGNYTKDEITSYLDNSNYSQLQKAYLFAAFASWKNAQNPY